ADEIARAVDRIDDPAVARCAELVAVLFTQKPVLGKLAEQSGSQQRFGVTIGDGDGAVILLPFDGHVDIEIAQGQLGGCFRCFNGCFVTRFPFGIHTLHLINYSFFTGDTRYLTVFGVSSGGCSYGSDFMNSTRSSMSSGFRWLVLPCL